MHGFILRDALVAAVVSLALVAAAQLPAAPPEGTYAVTPLVSDVPGAAALTDPNLVNGWGLTRSATSPWWVADNGPDPSTSKSTLYTGAGAINALVVNDEMVGRDGHRSPQLPHYRLAALLGHPT